MLKMDVDYIMDTVDGTLLSNATGDFIFDMHFDEVFTDCSVIEKIAIYFPEDINHKFNYVTKKFLRFVKKCIPSVRNLRLVSPNSKYLDLIGIPRNFATKIEVLSITDVSRLESEKRFIGNNMPDLKRIISIKDNNDLNQFALNKNVKQFTSKGHCTENGFKNLLSFIKRNELTEVLLLCENIEANDGETPAKELSIADIFRKIKTVQKQPLEFLRIIYLANGNNFSYSQKTGVIQVPIEFINHIDISLDYQHFEITHIESDDHVTKLTNFLLNLKMNKKNMKSLVVNVADKSLWEKVWSNVNHIERAIVRCDKDQIENVIPDRNYFTLSSAMQEDHPFMHFRVYTSIFFTALTDEIPSLRISYFGYYDNNLLSTLAAKILGMEMLIFLYIDSDNGLFGALQRELYSEEGDGLEMLHTLNIPKLAIFPFDQHIDQVDDDQIDILDRSLSRVIIRIDDPRDTSVQGHLDWLSYTYRHMTWSVDEDSNIAGVKIKRESRSRD